MHACGSGVLDHALTDNNELISSLNFLLELRCILAL
jgi:hypothetical protein